MSFGVKLIIQRGANYVYGNEWIQSCHNKIAEMVESKTTNGDLVPSRNPSQKYRFFTDVKSAQEFVDWWHNSKSPPNATFEIVEL